ncbi:TPA: hypothetical protein MJA79_18745 [Klebsiella pneumoniae]|uniref:Uncharacterized protein n=1 Tax=Klebsiella pneumoniae TaxID=573 RepID=A0A2X3FRQ5_KLEPN|nr:hypothetical protein [Serratia marcescens]SQC23562.1 Uncharacterised protein [Klebsiella pneumoniae]SQC25600.1 Uncharacterised protein [Klebsiella pneumoniae]STR97715.1 Uncharacterised protein [Klebsiella pneumoniae]STS65867.1 Uncharacterised protein [Klebsiella pneumoniae]STS69879.1 Uncharacterised protein [Klebsiella pneumoniae]
MNETYYYGQGKVYLARRDINGRPGAYRWLGDVSELAITLAFEQNVSKISRRGRLFNSRRFISGYTGSLAATWHNFSSDNLSLLLRGEATKTAASIVDREVLPAGINAGDRISLAHQNVWGVEIAGLTKGKDYIVDAVWGAIQFLITPPQQPVELGYQHAGTTSVPIVSNSEHEFALRFEGINLAERNSMVLVELYRLSYNPLAGWQLITSGTSLAGLETTAELLFDPSTLSDTSLGQFGRVTFFNELNGITHNGVINHSGQFTHGSN